MKLENQVCSLEYAQRLKELRIKQESICNWVSLRDNEWFVTFSPLDLFIMKGRNEFYSAFTVAELGEMLPNWFHSSKLIGNDDWLCRAFGKEGEEINTTFSETEANVRAKMIIYLIENGLMKND